MSSGSLAGRRGVAVITPDGQASLAISGSGIVGFSFLPGGAALVATSTSVYHVALGIEGWRLF